MRKSFLFNIFFLVFVNFLIKPFWVFGIDRTIQNKLGEAEYGIYFAVFNFTYLFQILLDFGLQNYNARHVAFDTKKIQELLPNILIFKTLLFFIYVFVCVGFSFPLQYNNYFFLYIIIINHFLLSFIIYLRSNITAHQYFFTDSLLSVLDKLLMIIFCSILIWGNLSLEININNFVLAQTFALAIAFIVCLLLSLQLSSSIHFSIHLNSLKKIIKTSAPYAITYFLMTTYYRIDGVMLEKMSGSEETGIYAQGYRIIEAINNIGYLLSLIMLPLFAYYLSTKKDVLIILFPSLKVVFIIIVSIVGIFYFESNTIISTLYHSNVNYSAQVFSWLILNFIPMGLLYIIGTLLTANENFKIMLPVLSVAVVINIVLNYYWINSNGALGAAQATLATQIFILFSYTIYMIKIFQIKLKFINILKYFTYIFLIFISIYIIQNIFYQNDIKYFMIRSFVYLTCVLIYSLLFKILDKSILNIKTGIS